MDDIEPTEINSKQFYKDLAQWWCDECEKLKQELTEARRRLSEQDVLINKLKCKNGVKFKGWGT